MVQVKYISFFWRKAIVHFIHVFLINQLINLFIYLGQGVNKMIS